MMSVADPVAEPDSAQEQSRSYMLPVEDLQFLLRDEMRGARFLLEYEKAELLLRDWGIRSTVIVFGSSRTTPELTFRFHYFAMRKMHLVMRANALAIFPGGFGTLDELFELLTLRQTGKAPFIPIVLFDRAYWSRVINFDTLVEEDMVDRANLALFDFADSAEEAWLALQRRGLRAHTPEPSVAADRS